MIKIVFNGGVNDVHILDAVTFGPRQRKTVYA